MESIASYIARAQSIYIVTHISPDGDAIGSTTGLYWALAALGKSCTMACASPVPASLLFIPGSDRFTSRPPDAPDLIISLDSSDHYRLGSAYSLSAFSAAPVINIDHHVTNTGFGLLNVVEPQAAATGEIIFDLVRGLGVPLDETIATCLLTAIITDTIGFRTINTTPKTIHVAAALVEAGGPLAKIVQAVFDTRPLAVTRLWGEVLTTFRLEDGVAWAAISRSMLQRYGVQEDDVKGLVNFLRSTEGVQVAVLLMETPEDAVKCEFRSNGLVDVSQVATALGGGGHRAAAGCTLAGPLAAATQQALAGVRKQMALPAATSLPA